MSNSGFGQTTSSSSSARPASSARRIACSAIGELFLGGAMKDCVA
jgi:hypothetical protein